MTCCVSLLVDPGLSRARMQGCGVLHDLRVTALDISRGEKPRLPDWLRPLDYWLARRAVQGCVGRFAYASLGLRLAGTPCRPALRRRVRLHRCYRDGGFPPGRLCPSKVSFISSLSTAPLPIASSLSISLPYPLLPSPIRTARAPNPRPLSRYSTAVTRTSDGTEGN